MSQRKRVERLEQATGTGAVEFVGIGRFDWTPEQLDQAVAEARERLGPGATVIGVEYTDEWRGPGDL